MRRSGGKLKPEVVMLLMLYAVLFLLYRIIIHDRDKDPGHDIFPVRTEVTVEDDGEGYIDAIGQPGKGFEVETEREETAKERLIREAGERQYQVFGLQDID